MKEDSLSPDAGEHTNMRAVQNLKEMDKKREGSRSEEEKGKTYIKANQHEEDEKREQN